MLDTNLTRYFSSFSPENPRAIETVLHRHNVRFAYYMLQALMPKVSQAVGLWLEKYGRGVDADVLEQVARGEYSLFDHEFKAHVWNDLDCRLVIFHSSDMKRIIICQKNISAFDYEYPLVYLEGHEAIAGRDFLMDDIKRIELHKVFEDLPQHIEEYGEPESIEDYVNFADAWADVASFPPKEAGGTMKRPNLGWYADAIERGPLELPRWFSRMTISLPSSKSDDSDFALRMEAENWRFECSLREFEAAMYMLDWAGEALERDETDE